jgi:RNA polymerase sigma factor (sigma-70 family)
VNADESQRSDILRERMDRLVRKHRGNLVSFARRFAPLSSVETAEGIVQDALLVMLEHSIQLPDVEREALAVVMRVIENAGRNRRRRDSVRAHVRLEDERLLAVGRGGRSWRLAWESRLRIAWQDALCHLTPAEREVTELHVDRGMTFDEIAMHRGCSPKTAKELYGRSRRKLRNLIKEGAPPG